MAWCPRRGRLAASRRYVAVGIAAVAAVVTPGGDITAPLILGAAMYGLFEVTLLFIRRRETAARRTSPSAIS
jgi:Sec-independent protein secretion pathway component TatC